MSKKVTDVQKEEMLKLFHQGVSIRDISLSLSFSIQTITRQLKIIIGDKEFKELKNKTSKLINSSADISEKKFSRSTEESLNNTDNVNSNNILKKEFNDINGDQPFFVIPPLIEGVELEKQKDLTSQPIESVELPKILYMIIDNKIELEPKLLKEYREWSFLPEEDLNRTILEVFTDQKIAKRNCNKNQKLIKIPNPNVFLIASSKLKSKGITRIILDNLLISL